MQVPVEQRRGRLDRTLPSAMVCTVVATPTAGERMHWCEQDGVNMMHWCVHDALVQT